MEILDTNGFLHVMHKASIGIALTVALLASVYWIGRMDCTNSYKDKALDTIDGLMEQQAEIDKENFAILQEQSKRLVEQNAVSEAINYERKKNKKQSRFYLSRGDVRVLNAANSNQKPEAIRPRLTDAEKRADSTIGEQDFIDDGIKYRKKYNDCAVKRNGLIDLVRKFQEKSNELVCD